MTLYRVAEVPDPNGVLADLIEELLDNSALVEVTPDIEAMAEAMARHAGYDGTGPGPDYWIGMAEAALAALGITEDTDDHS